MGKAGKKPKKVFLSYAHRDGKELAFWLHEQLGDAGFEPWLDRDRLKPGENWSRGIEKALDDADAVVAVAEPGSRRVERSAGPSTCGRCARAGAVLAVRTGEDVDPPLYLEQTQWITFGGGAEQKRLGELVEALGGSDTVAIKAEFRTTKYQTVPTLPVSYVPRPDDLERLRDKLLAGNEHRHIAITAARGMGGAGKTVLAQALCERDEMIQAAFPDGIVWVTIGQEPEIVGAMREIPRALLGAKADVAGWDSLVSCENQLKGLLQGKSVLLVLDDVWDATAIRHFRVDEPKCRILLTTCSAEVVRSAEASEHCVDELSPKQARALLAKRAGLALKDLPPEADEVIAECGRLPLAIAMTGAMVRGDDGYPWADVLEMLRGAELEWIDEKPDQYLHENLFRALHASVETLPDELQDAYLDLAVFGADAGHPGGRPPGVVGRIGGGRSADCEEARGLLSSSTRRREAPDVARSAARLCAEPGAEARGGGSSPRCTRSLWMGTRRSAKGNLGPPGRTMVTTSNTWHGT